MANGKREYICAVVLVIINLLNYVDRYTVAGVLNEIQDYFDIEDGMAGLIQTVFLAFFLFGSPICGYLGDRYNRKWIILVGVVIWLGAVMGSSFVGRSDFWLFLLLRGIVGIGEASYSNVAPSMISDMFSGVARSRVYMLFYFAVPVGSGLGFIVGSNVATATGGWQWGVRVSAIAGAGAVLIHLLLAYEPERGAADKEMGLEVAQKDDEEKGSYWEDLKALVKIPSYIFCTFGYTALVFVTGTLTWWEPTIIANLYADQQNLNDSTQLEKKYIDEIGLIFGGITSIAGLLGVSLGTLLAGWMMKGTGIFRLIQTPRAQPIVAGSGALLAAPLLALVFLFGLKSVILLWILMFFVITFLSLNWGLNVDMLMGVIIPPRRSTAFSYYTLVSHLLGDAAGPYLIGAISDAIRDTNDLNPKKQYWALVKASACTVGLLVVSGVLYYLTALCLVRDQKKFQKEMGVRERQGTVTRAAALSVLHVETIVGRDYANSHISHRKSEINGNDLLGIKLPEQRRVTICSAHNSEASESSQSERF